MRASHFGIDLFGNQPAAPPLDRTTELRSPLRLSLAAATTAALVLLVAAPASAAPRSIPATDAMYVVSCDDIGGSTEVLFSVDSATGATTQIGSGIGSMSGCAGQPAWDATTNTAYYFDFFPVPTLNTIDLATGATTTVAPFSLGVLQPDVEAIAIGLDGAAYALAEGTLYKLDLATAELSDPLPSKSDVLGFAVDPTSGLFYAVTDIAEVYSIDVATGIPTFLDQLAFLPSLSSLSLQIDSAGTFWYLNSLDPTTVWSTDGSTFAGTEELSGPTDLAGTTENVFTEALLIAPNVITPAAVLPETGADATAALILGTGAALTLMLGAALVVTRRRGATA